MAKNELPKYKITIDPEYSDGEKLGIDKIAHTSNPAIKIKGMAFNKQTELKFSTDEKKLRIAAPLMIPMDIYRNDDSEYYVEFTASEIENIHKDFMKNLTNKNIYNEEHDNNRISDKSYLLEALLVDTENKVNMIKSDYNMDVPLGTLFTITQIEDEDYYNYLVENDMLGLSLEGFLGLKLNSQNKNKEQNMEDKLMLPDGEHTIGDKIYVIKDGAVVEVKDVVKEEMAEVPAEEDKVVDEKMAEVPVEEEIPAESDKSVECEDVVEEEVPVEEEVKVEEEAMEVVPADEEAIMAIVQPKLDELIQMIAEVKSMIGGEVKPEGEQVQLSAQELRFKAMMSLHNAFNK